MSTHNICFQGKYQYFLVKKNALSGDIHVTVYSSIFALNIYFLSCELIAPD